jgi:DNA-binding NarL/FixJ family response regulator
MSDQTISMILLDDHAMFRQALTRALESVPGFTVTGQFGGVADALGALRANAADIVLLDVDLGAENGLEFVRECRGAGFAGYILVVTAGISLPEAVQLARAGVAGILHKSRSTAELFDAIRGATRGEVHFEPEYSAAVAESSGRPNIRKRTKLTGRDRVVLGLLLEGLGNRAMADRLGISESGVKSSLRQLFDKLGVRTRAQLVKTAIERRLASSRAN